MQEVGVDGRMFINGERLAARSGKTFDAIDPASGSAFARVAEGDQEDIDAAVEVASRAAGSGWSATPT